MALAGGQRRQGSADRLWERRGPMRSLGAREHHSGRAQLGGCKRQRVGGWGSVSLLRGRWLLLPQCRPRPPMQLQRWSTTTLRMCSPQSLPASTEEMEGAWWARLPVQHACLKTHQRVTCGGATASLCCMRWSYAFCRCVVSWLDLFVFSLLPGQGLSTKVGSIVRACLQPPPPPRLPNDNTHSRPEA